MAQMPDGQRRQIVSELRAMQKVYDDAAKAAATAAQSHELTALGRREALKRLATGAVDAMKTHDEKVAAIVRSAADTRTKAIQAPAIERTQEVLMVEREIREDAAKVTAEKAAAIAWAKANGWPIKGRKQDGGNFELMSLGEDGQLQFYETQNRHQQGRTWSHRRRAAPARALS